LQKGFFDRNCEGSRFVGKGNPGSGSAILPLPFERVPEYFYGLFPSVKFEGRDIKTRVFGPSNG
jgi:hypothetical protein